MEIAKTGDGVAQGTSNLATPTFVLGATSKASLSKNLRSSTQNRTLSRPSSLSLFKPIQYDDAPNRHPRPKTHAAARPNRKTDNTPVPQSVPLAFPASSSFTFKAPDSDIKFSFSVTSGGPSIRSIHILPTDALALVIQFIEPSRHHQILKNLSLVNQSLNAAIAPILYHRVRLSNIKEVYDFSLCFRRPSCIVSLEMFITPDPRDPGWSPPDTAWTQQLIEKLGKLERLLSLDIKRCDINLVLSSISGRANDRSFLPALQKLSFGHWHELASLSSGRSITSYGLAFTIQSEKDYARIERVLAAIKQSSKAVQELKLIVNINYKPIPSDEASIDYRKVILQAAFEHMPELRALVLRARCRNGPRVHSPKATDVPQYIPRRMEKLTHLEIYDPRISQYRSEATIKLALELSKETGLCPMLESLNLDGLLWKRVPTMHSPSRLDIASLTLNEKGKPISNSSEKRSHTFFPKVTWTPCPLHTRGRLWWARRAVNLHANSQTQAVFLLRQWMLHYWGPEHVPSYDGLLERAVTKW